MRYVLSINGGLYHVADDYQLKDGETEISKEALDAIQKRAIDDLDSSRQAGENYHADTAN